MMNKVAMKVAMVVFTILLQVTLCVGADNSDEKPKLQEQTVAPTQGATTLSYLNVSFDPSIEKIPVPYLGHNIEQVYKAFDERKKTLMKDEFESTEQYQRRVATQAEKPLLGSVGQDSILAFVVSPSLAYDADSQTLTISLPTEAVREWFSIDKSRLAVAIKRFNTFTHKSIGQNAFGATVEIEERRTVTYQLAIHNQFNFEIEKVFLDEFYRKISIKRTAFVHRLKIGPEEARAAKDKMAALILAKPIAPYISYGEVSDEATFSNPIMSTVMKYYVDVDLTEIWIYDKLSGEIISKIKTK